MVGRHQRSYSTLGSVSTVNGDRLWAGKPRQYVAMQPPRLTQPREINTCKSAVMLCNLGLKAGWLVTFRVRHS